MGDEGEDVVPSVDVLFKEKGVDDPATMHILFSMGVVTAGDLHEKTVEDMLKAGLTRIQARKLEHISKVVCSHRLGSFQEISGIREKDAIKDTKSTSNSTSSFIVAPVPPPPPSSSQNNIVSNSPNSTNNSSRVVGTSLDRPNDGPVLTASVHSNDLKVVRKRSSSSGGGGGGKQGVIDETASVVTSLSLIKDELNVIKDKEKLAIAKSRTSPDHQMLSSTTADNEEDSNNPTSLLIAARKLAELNKLGEATARCEKAVALLTLAENGEDQIESMSAIGFLAELYLHRRRLDIACSHAEWLLKIKKRKMGEEDLSTADAMFMLGEIQKRRGFLSEAAAQLRWCLRVRESMLGEDHIKTGISLHSLGNCFLRQSVILPEKLFDARTVLIRGLKVKLQHYGMDHVETARSLDNVAAALFLQGRYQPAIDVYAKALQCKIRTIGYDNALVGDSLFGMGAIARDRGNVAGSLEFYSKSLLLYTKSLGEAHSITKCVNDEYQNLIASQSNIIGGSNAGTTTQSSYQLGERVNNEGQEGNQRSRRPSQGTASNGGKGNSFKIKVIRPSDHSPDRHVNNKLVENRDKLSKISELGVSTPKSKLSRNHTNDSRDEGNKESFNNGTTIGGSFNRGSNGNRGGSFQSGVSANIDDSEKPRTTAAPVRRRPETARSSWDMEEDYNSTDFLNNIQIGENPDDDIMKFLFSDSVQNKEESEFQNSEGMAGHENEPGIDVVVEDRQGQLRLPAINDMMKRAISRKNIKNKTSVGKKSNFHTQSSLGYSSEILYDKSGRAIAVLSGGFEESHSF